MRRLFGEDGLGIMNPISLRRNTGHPYLSCHDKGRGCRTITQRVSCVTPRSDLTESKGVKMILETTRVPEERTV